MAGSQEDKIKIIRNFPSKVILTKSYQKGRLFSKGTLFFTYIHFKPEL